MLSVPGPTSCVVCISDPFASELSHVFCITSTMIQLQQGDPLSTRIYDMHAVGEAVVKSNAQNLPIC